MTHDPLCPFAKWDDVDCYQHDAGVRICDLIAKVREDMLAKCLAAVEALMREDEHWGDSGWNNALYEIERALRALEEKL